MTTAQEGPRCRLLDRPAAIYFRDILRDARAGALADAEGCSGMFIAIEAFGAYLKNDHRTHGLGRYRNVLIGVASESTDDRDEFTAVLGLVLDARNDRMHEGAVARRAASHAVSVALALEDGMAEMTELDRVEHFMVRNPVRAEVWQTFKVVRREMLTHQFSFLPIHVDNVWHLVSEFDLAAYLRHPERKKRLNMTVEEALRGGMVRLRPAITVPEAGLVDEVFAVDGQERTPRVVVTAAGDIVGILTPFDLL